MHVEGIYQLLGTRRVCCPAQDLHRLSSQNPPHTSEHRQGKETMEVSWEQMRMAKWAELTWGSWLGPGESEGGRIPSQSAANRFSKNEVTCYHNQAWGKRGGVNKWDADMLTQSGIMVRIFRVLPSIEQVSLQSLSLSGIPSPILFSPPSLLPTIHCPWKIKIFFPYCQNVY